MTTAATDLTYGQSLRDALPLVSNHIANGLQFMHDFREFVKERSAVEREYAKNLDALVRRHSVRVEKRMRDLSLGTLVPPGKDEECYSTAMQAWATVLIKTEAIGKERAQFADRLLSEVSGEVLWYNADTCHLADVQGTADKTKVTIQRKEEARKKHIAFAAKLTSDRDKLLAEKDKNNYLIALSTANTTKKSFYCEEIPWIMDELQDLEYRRLDNMKAILGDLVRIDAEMATTTCQLVEALKPSVDQIQPDKDIHLFVKTNQRDWTEPADFTFDPTHLWRDTNEFVKDDQTKVVLQNQRAKVLKKKKGVLVELDEYNKIVDGLTKMYNAYKTNARLGDFEEIKEQMVHTLRSAVMAQSAIRRYDAQLPLLEAAIGGRDNEQLMHTLKTASFAIPVPCDVCSGKIWGMGKVGLTCSACGFHCHAKCELKVPSNCMGEQMDTLEAPDDSPTTSWTPTKREPSEAALSTISPTKPSPLRENSNLESSSFHDLTVSRNVGSTNELGSYLPSLSMNDLKLDLGSSLNLSPSPESKSPTEATQSRARKVVGKTSRSPSPTRPVIKAAVLYDYSPANSDELQVSCDEVVTVVDPDDGSGWTKVTGVLGTGLIPAAYVRILEGASRPLSTQQPDSKRASALYAYEAQAADELSITEGQVLELVEQGKPAEDGWCQVRAEDGRVGHVPATYIAIL
ncbi:Protein BZZ1 [Sorochytrium milnesiophthora]